MAVTMAFATMGLMSSCSSDDLISPSGESNMLKVNVTPSNAQNTRAAATTNPSDATENTVSRIAVGVFSSDGTTKRIIVDQATNNNGVALTTDGLTSGDKVLVAVNAPGNAFKDVTSADEFKAKTLAIGDALYGAGKRDNENMADNNHIPMYGEGTISNAGTKNYTANINVYHLVSKVSLQSIKVDFTKNSVYQNATFQPTEIFMANVPDKLGLSMANSATSYKFTTPENYVSGEQTTDAPTGKDAITASSYPYLSTGTLTLDANAEGSAKTYKSDMPIFYTMPNNQTAGEAKGATFLVIKGKFTNDGASETCYYPVYLNYNTNKNEVPDGGTEKVVSPNYNYRVSVVINGKGSDSPTTPVANSSASVTITANPFVGKDATVNVNGTRIGDYVFNDGSWGPLENVTADHYPIAVIFSNSPSENDIKDHFTHGYAMALAAAGPSCPWATTGATGLTNPVQDKLLTDIAAIKSDYNGRAETNKVLALDDAKADDYKNLKTLYPAFYYATRFGTAEVGYNDNTGWGTETQSGETKDGSVACAAPMGTSGWYLGSIGQYYLVAKNLGGNMSDETDGSWLTGGSTYWYVEGKSFDNAAGVSKYITAAAKAMSDAGVSAYTPNEIKCETGGWHSTWYWTSSEFSAGHGFLVYWGENGNFRLDGNPGKSVVYAYNRGVRPVLAF